MNQKLITENPQSTVVAKYISSDKKAENYQSEAELEKEFIKQLESQAYEYLQIHKEQDLIENLRTQLEKLNNYKFSDREWEQFFKTEIANQNNWPEEKTKTIQEDSTKILKKDDGTIKNIKLIDKENIHNNHLQVINQYSPEWWTRENRYDVTILVNGLPLVHIELKRRWVAIKEAFNQINRYGRESFWASNGLFEYVQIFVISNGTHTKYYSNTTRYSHVDKTKNIKKKKSSNSFEFTSYWADETNKPILDLIDFTKTFFTKHSLLNILTKYCVFTVDKSLLVMRPYQIVATEKILNKIEIAHNYKNYGTIKAWWYIWHTTWSGKTLTSFKTAQLATKLPYIKKVLFVVDRKDLDYQTMKEYDKFEKGAANSNTSTRALQKQLENPDSKIIITTIQKLDKFIKKNKGHSIFDGEVVLIFDECHRSQFWDMHKAITKAFKKYYIFGFTWTPIFAVNSSSKHADLKTTQQAFGDKLHTYTIVDAIADKNVLPFKIDYVSTLKSSQKAENEDEKVEDIDRQKALQDPRRIKNIVSYIIKHFDQKTKRNKFYEVDKKRLAWFNSIFAVSSIDMAKLYYLEFQKQLENLPSDKKLKIATIFSYAANEQEPDGTIDENPEDTSKLDQSSRDFLEDTIKDYNKMFGTSYDTSAKNFQNYYKNVSEKVKNKEIDILIVVNMFLTGFDAKTLNTLWIDKNLQYHGLIQAYSRTNRILNSIKTFWNIVSFRNLENATNKAIWLFGDKEAKSLVLLKKFEDYFYGYEENGKKIKWYKDLIEELESKFPIWEKIIEEDKQKEFVKLYGKILRLRNILTVFDKFEEKELLSQREIQDYHSMYIDLYNEFRKKDKVEKEVINDDLVFEMELIKQVEINIDYILELIRKYHQSNKEDKEIRVDIEKAINSSIELRNKKDLIEQFIEKLDISAQVDEQWREFISKKKQEELEQIIKEENLKQKETYKFIENSFRDGEIQELWTEISKILPPISPFDKKRYEKKKTVLDKLKRFFERFFGI